jgi:thiol-disulfide isomerase/thioredoxin
MRLVFSLLFLAFFIPHDNYALNVHVQGEWLNGPESVNLHYLEDAVTPKTIDLKAIIDPVSRRFEFNIELDRPALLQLLNQLFIVLPGDTANLVITGSEGTAQLHFEGPKGMEHSFLIRLKTSLGLFMVQDFAVNEHTIDAYKLAATRHYDSCVLFLNHDVAEKRASPAFEKIAQDYLTMRYYSDLLFPLTIGAIRKEQLPKYYFELVNFSFFKKAELLGFREFVLAVAYYNAYYYAAISPEKPYDSVNVAAKIKSANRNFLGEVKDHLLLQIFVMLTKRGTVANSAQIQTLFEYLSGVFGTDDGRMQQLKDLKHAYEIVDRPLPQEILAQELKTLKGKSVSLKEVLTSDEVVYVDFWASWCGPCLGEMPYEKQLMAELEGSQVKFISISFDQDEKKWQKAMAKIKMKGDHYLMTEGFRSALAKYISFNEIPRYVIVDKEGRLVSREAPRPSDILKNKAVLLGVTDQGRP